MTFSNSYFEARDRFRQAAAQLGWHQESHAITARGPTGEELTLDVACSPGEANWPVLFITSGVHGVEGFFGSAVQLQTLQNWTASTRFRCVMIHAVSPYGFAHLRRFDENNVDSNRNFLLPGEDYSGSPPLYAECEPVVNPPSPPRWPDGFLWNSIWFIWKYGFVALKQAVAGGQYDFPKGVFYGGAGPCEASGILFKLFPQLLQNAAKVIHLDFHTGLGRWATYKLLMDYPLQESQKAVAWKCFGESNIQEASPHGIDYHTRGGFGPWCVQHNPGRDYLFFCAEFGTYSPLSNLKALRQENQATHWGTPLQIEKARAKLLEAFVPASPKWRSAVLADSAKLVQQAREALEIW